MITKLDWQYSYKYDKKDFEFGSILYSKNHGFKVVVISFHNNTI